MTGFWRLLSYLKNYRKYVALNILFNILMALFMVVSIPAIIPFFQILFDREVAEVARPEIINSLSSIVSYAQYEFSQLMINHTKETALAYICIILVLLFFCKNLFRYLSLYFMAPVRNGMVKDLRSRLFHKLVHLPISFFGNHKKGDLLSRMTSDVQEIEVSILNVLETFFKEPIVIIGSIGFMIYVSPGLSLFVLILLFFTVFVIGGVSRTLKKKSSIAQGKLGHLLSNVDESIHGIKVVKSFNAEYIQEEKFKETNLSYMHLMNRIMRRRDLSSPLSEFLGIGIVALLLWYGATRVFQQEIAAETFFAFLFAFYNVINPAKAFSSAYYNIQKGLAGIDRVEEILHITDHIEEVDHPTPLKHFDQALSFNDVNFYYKGHKEKVLHNINLHINKGDKIAVVGSSGSGKSTLIDLIPRFHDPSSGHITIDGIDLREYGLKDLRSLIAIVPQEPILFNDTISKNISYGIPGTTKEAIISAAKSAYAHDFISDLEQGYETNVGDRGLKLSGGEKQRIALARALLKNPPILIFDEATSALDAASESLIQKALEEVLVDRTAIIIAHRFTTIQHVDRIVVIKDGQIFEEGSHRDLMEGKGEYFKFFELQGI